MSKTSRRSLLTGLTAAAGTALFTGAVAQSAMAYTGYAKTTKYTAMRSTPSWSGAWIRGLDAGTVVMLTGNASNGWMEISLDSRRGWVHSTYLQTISDPPVISDNAKPVTKFYQRHTYGTKSSYYHVYANGIDWSKPVGISWYFDGDQSFRDQLIVGNPEYGNMKQMGYEANRRNFIMIGVESPSYVSSGGWTWWIDGTANGEYFRSLAAKILKTYPMLSQNRQWLTGWSGGAEFVSMYLMSTKQRTWWTFGGTTIVGGGDSPYKAVDTTSPTFRGIWASWHVADDDDYTAAKSGWSAERAATDGESHYRRIASYWRTRLMKYAAGYGAHHSYNIPVLMATDMNRAGYRPLR